MLDRKERKEIDNTWFLSYREIYTKKKKRKIDTFVPIAWNEFEDLFEHSDSDSNNDDDSRTVLNNKNSNILLNRNRLLQGNNYIKTSIMNNMRRDLKWKWG